MPLLGAAVALVVLARVLPTPAAAAGVVQGLGYLAALAVLWQNRAHLWMVPIFVGLGLNSLVMVLNGGRMPISQDSLMRVAHGIGPQAAAAGLDPRHVPIGPGTRLAPLGDIVPLGAGALGLVLSPGDLLMALGLAGFVQGEMRRARDGPRR
jgi:hypothetical protein